MNKKSLLILLTLCLSNIVSANNFLSSANSPFVYGPAIVALTLSFTKYDGEITEYASRHRPIYGSVENAKKRSDQLTFYALPVYAATSTFFKTKKNDSSPNWLQYSSFLFAPLSAYLFNDLIKNQSGRVRPDNSNLESFPSSHTAIASAFSGYINNNTNESKHYKKVVTFNELIVLSIAWARLEAKKHHLTDTLVGYSIGKYFSNLFHSFVFKKKNNVSISFNVKPKEMLAGRINWHF